MNEKLLIHSWGNKPEQKRREKQYNHEYYLKNKDKWQKSQDFWDKSSSKLQKSLDTLESRSISNYGRKKYSVGQYKDLTLNDVDRNKELKNFYKNLDAAYEPQKKQKVIDKYVKDREDEIDKRVKKEYEDWLIKNRDAVYSDPNYKEVQRQQKFKIKQQILGEIQDEAESFYEKNKTSLNKSYPTDYEDAYLREYNKHNREHVKQELADFNGDIAARYLADPEHRTPIATQEFSKWKKLGAAYLADPENRTPEKVEAYNKFKRWVEGEADVAADAEVLKRAKESYKNITGQSNSAILAKKKRQQQLSKSMAENEAAKADANQRKRNLQKLRNDAAIDKLQQLKETADKNAKNTKLNLARNEVERDQAEREAYKNRKLSKKARDFIDGTVEVALDTAKNKLKTNVVGDFLVNLTKKKKKR